MTVPASPPGRNPTKIGVVGSRRIIGLDEPFLIRKIDPRHEKRSKGAPQMRNWKPILKTAFIMIPLLGTGAAAAHADSFGAISLSPATGATGWSHDYSSRWEAEEVAQSHCYKYAGDCRVAIWFKNACGAVARGPDGWGADWAAGRRQAQRAALAACSNHSYGCEVIRWQCSGGY